MPRIDTVTIPNGIQFTIDRKNDTVKVLNTHPGVPLEFFDDLTEEQRLAEIERAIHFIEATYRFAGSGVFAVQKFDEAHLGAADSDGFVHKERDPRTIVQSTYLDDKPSTTA